MESFHPVVRRWFEARFGTPTHVQGLSWPRIASGENLLITAPTGSGKTLTAFLWAINQFVTGELETGTTRVLYISPLKALNNDIQRNLIAPLSELESAFAQEGLEFPAIRVLTRSGDTDQAERRRMLRYPPEILITTPESLNLLLSARSGHSLLTGIKTVILDEIHGVIGTKRGVYLMTAVERLVPMSGEFQRIALSATVNPLPTVARFVAGYIRDGTSFEPRWIERPIDIIASSDAKQYRISIRYPEGAAQRSMDEEVWDSLVEEFVATIKANRSTLLFVNSRALCEKITYKINEAAGETLAWSHHGSLSRELRFEVEQKLKAGQLAAIVATSTLEMGIDIGELDEVILVQSPDAVSSAVQRIGRAGHGVGETSVSTIYPTHPMDFIEAAVLGRAILEKDIEAVRPVECPLDVLAQVIISMTGVETWDLDELYTEIRRTTPYHRLTRNQFDLVINMLAGRYAENHIRELRPRISIDRMANQASARPGALMSLYLSGGVIPDRGYFQLRHEESNARIGELDEEFVWEANVGQVFSFGAQNWQVRKITHNDVIVAPGKRTGVAPPFWKAEPIARDFHFSNRVGEFLEYAEANIASEGFEASLASAYHLDPVLARELYAFLVRQREHTRAPLPHRHHILAETINLPVGREGTRQMVLHTGWGSRVNRPWAMALEAGWHDRFGEQPEIYVTNQLLIVQLAHEVTLDEVLSLAPARDLDSRLRERLEGSGFFGARFRENAGRALLLAKGKFNERKPLWMSRLQSQKLLSSVLKYEDFPILLETWRTCLNDEFDLTNLRLLLDEIERGEIVITETRSETPSPFAQTASWGQVNTYMYMTDDPKSSQTSSLRQSLIEEAVFSPDIRPRVTRPVIDEFEERRQRRLPGYEPEGDQELIDWIEERTAIPRNEWRWSMPGQRVETLWMGTTELIVSTADVETLRDAWYGDDEDDNAATYLANWLQYYGPLRTGDIASRLGMAPAVVETLLTQLEAERTVISGTLVEGDEARYWCDAANYEALLRFMRQASRMAFETMPVSRLPLFLYTWQTRFASTDPIERLFEILERFRCLPLPASTWEAELLPSRLAGYDPSQLDALFQEGGLMWIGAGEGNIAFCFADDTDLMAPDDAPSGEAIELLAGDARYDFNTLLDRSGRTAAEINKTLWAGVWSGAVTNDSIAALRKGIESGFEVPEASVASTRRRSVRRGGFNRWRGSIPLAGTWRRIEYPPGAPDLLTREELNKDRVRVLLDRYGVLFRELLQRELPSFSWRALFRSIRLMELSGEIVSGYFFDGIPGPQFASPAAFRLLQRGFSQDTIFWLNAADPVSMSGIGLDAFKGQLPRRIGSSHMVYHGETLVLVSERGGRSITINVPETDPNLPRYLDVFRHLMYRKFQPAKKIQIEEINGEPATKSPWLDAFQTAFDVIRDHKAVYIQREI